MSYLNFHNINATFPFFFLIDTHWHCCAFFLPFLHLFFLPVTWPIDLAVQGCKYHCGFFHSRPPFRSLISSVSLRTCPSTDSPLATVRVLTGALSCWGLLRQRCYSTSPFMSPYITAVCCTMWRTWRGLSAAKCQTWFRDPLQDNISISAASRPPNETFPLKVWNIGKFFCNFEVVFFVCCVPRVTRDPATTLPLRVSQRESTLFFYFHITCSSTKFSDKSINNNASRAHNMQVLCMRRCTTSGGWCGKSSRPASSW